MELDQYYTPPMVAHKLLCQKIGKPRNVCDFCAGGGELLVACENHYPSINCVAIDKSPMAVRHLRHTYPHWRIYTADFLNARQMRRLNVLQDKFDLVVMNPPFTCRGSVYQVSFNGFVFKASKAMLFLVKALNYVNDGGHLLAVLPTGVLCSQRDAELVRYLKRFYGFRVYEHFSNVSFGGKMPNVFLVDLQKRDVKIDYKVIQKKRYVAPYYLHRGCCNVVSAVEAGPAALNQILKWYVHSTNLHHGEVWNLSLRLNPEGRREIIGPAVLLPRVGTPALGKIVVIRANDRYILSDCVIGILCSSFGAAQKTKSALVKSYASYSALYKGTGARYVTLQCLDRFIRKHVERTWLRFN